MSPPWVKSKDPKSKQKQKQKDQKVQSKQQNLNFQSKSHEIQKKSQDKIQEYQQKTLQQNLGFDTIYDNQNFDKKQEQNNEINLDFDEPKKKEEQIQQKQKFNFLNRPSEKQQLLNSIKNDNEQELQQQKVIQNLQPQKFCESPDIADVLEIINNQDNKKQEQSQDINEKQKYTQQSSDSQEYNQAQYIDCDQEEIQNENQKISKENRVEQKNQESEQFLEQIKQKNKQDLNYYEIMQLGVDFEQSSDINNEISQYKNQEEQQQQENQYESQENNQNLEEKKNKKKVVNFQNSELNSEQEEDSIFMSEEEDYQESGEEKKIQENSVKQIYKKKIEQKQKVQKNKLCDASQSQKQHFNDVILKDQNLIKKIQELLQKYGDFDPNFEVINDSDQDENQKKKENNKEQESKGKKSKKLPYKIIDDLKLIIGVKELPNKMQNFQGYGPHFYKTLMQKKYASTGRSPDSLRDRHLKYLSVLNENDIYKILDFVKENGINGYINFFNDLDQQTRKYLNCTKGHITKLDKKNIETYEKFAVKEDSIDQSEILQILEEEQNQDSQIQDQKFSNFQNQQKNIAQNKNNYTQQHDSNKIYTVSKSGDKTVMEMEQVDKYDNKQVKQQEKISVHKLSLLEKQQLYKNKIQNDIQELSKNKQENVKKIDISELVSKQSSNKKKNQIQDDDENYSSEIVEIQDDENDIDNENDNSEQHFGQRFKEQQFLKQISSTKKSIISKKTSPYSNQEETKIDEIQNSGQYQNQQKVQNQQKQFQLVENQLMDPNLIDPQLNYSFKKISNITNSNIKNRSSSINQQYEQIEEGENNEISAKEQNFPSLQKQKLNQNKYKGDQQYFYQLQQQQNQQFSGSSNKQNKKRKQNEFDYQQNFGDYADSSSPDFYLQENSSEQNLVYENLNQYFKNSSQKQQQQQKSTSIYEQQQLQQNNCQCDIYKEIDQDFGLNQVQKQQYKKNKVFKSIYDKQLRNSALNSIDMTKIWVQKKLVLMDTQQEQQIVKWTQNLLKNTQPQIYQSQQNNFNSRVINVISKNFKGFELNRQCENVKIANIDGLNYFIETHIKKQEDLDQEQMEEFIQDLMEKYGLQQNQFYKVFESVSYNPEDLALVMEKNMQNLQWDEEDDEILKNAENQNDRSFKLLLRYKGKERIQRRVQFKNFDLKFDVMKD